MKLKKLNQKKYNLIGKNLFNTRSYLGLKKLSLYYLNFKYIQGFKNKFCVFELFKTKMFLKNIFKVIYKYHCLNNKILFIGFPEFKNNKFSKLFDQTNHYYIPLTIWRNNIITNRSQVLYHLQNKSFYSPLNKKNYYKIFKIKKIPDLIVLYNQKFELTVIKESLVSNIPVIIFLNSSDSLNHVTYKIPIGYQVKKSEKIFYLLLKSILTFSVLKKKFKNINIKNRFFKKNFKRFNFWY